MQPMQVTGKLPEGIESIGKMDEGIGEFLVIRMKNGLTVTLEALQLTPDYECSVRVWKDPFDLTDPNNMMAGVWFDAENPHSYE